MSDAMRMEPPTYGRHDLVDLADGSIKEARIVADGRGVTGVALPDWPSIAPCAIMSPARARQLGAQLILAADEHDAIAEGALSQFGPPTPGEARRVSTRVEELRSTLLKRLETVPDVHDRAALRGAVEELAELRLGDVS